MDGSGNTALSDALNNSTFGQYMQGVSETLGRSADRVANSISDNFKGVTDYFLNNTIVGNILSFIWDLITFVVFSIKSIILLVWNLLYSILNGFVEMFNWLGSTFHDLSYFMGVKTSMLISMFILVLLLIGFQFLLRLFLGKFHYNKVSKK